MTSLPPIKEPQTGPGGPHGTASPRRPTEVKVAVQDQRERHVASRRRWDLRILFAICCLVALWAAPRVAWRLTPRRAAAIAIVDRTVPLPDRAEHAALTWWLDHARRATADGRPFDVRRDYVGWDPVTKREGALDSALAGKRLAYVADAYGVYQGDLRGGRAALEHTPQVEGGVSLVEAQALAAFRARGGVVVAEFNTLESPTSGTAAGALLERTLGAHYLGWVARWYRDLASEDDIAPWMRERWRRRTGTPWAFTGGGYVVFAEDDDRIVVLPARHFEGRAPLSLALDRPDDPLVAGVRAGTRYDYWTPGLAAGDSGVVLASWVLDVDAEGARLLAAQRFPLRWAAIVRHARAPLAAYVGADLAELHGAPRGRRTRGMDWWYRWRAPDEEEAMRGIALPLWDNVARGSKL